MEGGNLTETGSKAARYYRAIDVVILDGFDYSQYISTIIQARCAV